MSAKVPAVVRLAKQALTDYKCVVIGLQSTGEARTEEAVTKYVSVFFISLAFCCLHFLFGWESRFYLDSRICFLYMHDDFCFYLFDI